MRKKKIIDLSKRSIVEIVKIPLTLIPLILFALGLIKIITEWRSVLRSVMGIVIPDPNANGVNILIGLALITSSITTLTLLVHFKAALQGWLTSSLLFLTLFLFLILLIATPLFDIIAAKIFFTKGSCEFFVESYGNDSRGKELAEFCNLGKKTFNIRTN